MCIYNIQYSFNIISYFSSEQACSDTVWRQTDASAMPEEQLYAIGQ